MPRPLTSQAALRPRDSYPFLDRARADGSAQFTPFVAAMGSVLSSPALVEAANKNQTSPLMARASALAGVISAMVFPLDSTRWQSELGRLTNTGFASETVRIARSLQAKSKLSSEDAFASALALQFLTGALAVQSGADLSKSSGYRAALASFDQMSKSIPGASTVRQQLGLNGLQRPLPQGVVASFNGSAALPSLSGLGALKGVFEAARDRRLAVPVVPKTPAGRPASGFRIGPPAPNLNGLGALGIFSSGYMQDPVWIAVFNKVRTLSGAPDVTLDPSRIDVSCKTNDSGGPNAGETWQNRRDQIAAAANTAIPQGRGYGYGPTNWQDRPDATVITWWIASQGWVPREGIDAPVLPEGSTTANIRTLNALLTQEINRRGIGALVASVNAAFVQRQAVDGGSIPAAEGIALAQSLAPRLTQGADGLSNAEIMFWSHSRWCSTGVLAAKMKAASDRRFAGGDYIDFEDFADRNLLTNIAFDSQVVAGAIADAGDELVSLLEHAADGGAALMCKAFNSLFPNGPVGGILCTLFKILITGPIGGTATIFEVISISFQALFQVIGDLAAGRPADAAWAVATSLTTTVLMLLGGPLSSALNIPITNKDYTDAVAAAHGVVAPDGTNNVGVLQSLEYLGAQLTKRDPFFVVQLAMAVVGFIYGGESPTGLANIIVAVAPAAAVLFAPILRADFTLMAAFSTDIIANGVETIIKVVGMVIVGVMTLQDVVTKFYNALQSFVMKAAATGGKSTDSVSAMAAKLIPVVQDSFNTIINAKMDKIGAALSNIMVALPLLIIAVALGTPTTADASNSLKQIQPVQVKTIDDARAVWNTAQVNVSQLPPDLLMQSLRTEILALQSTLNTLCSTTPATSDNAAWCVPATSSTSTGVGSANGAVPTAGPMATVSPSSSAPATATIPFPDVPLMAPAPSASRDLAIAGGIALLFVNPVVGAFVLLPALFSKPSN